MEVILYSVLSIGGIGLVFGAILGFAGEKLKVIEDPKIKEVRDALPSANCGGCGYAGCDAFANAVVKGEAPINGCPVGGNSCIEALSVIMGVEPKSSAKTVAFVKCGGDCQKAKEKYVYNGMESCHASNILADGHKSCSYGCLGDGSCYKKCDFDAIRIVDGLAIIDKDKCVSCGLCVPACPRNLIEIVPYDSKVLVKCNSKDVGKIVRVNCSIGCISCKICEKACEFDAIHVNDNLAKIDYDKCTNCNACAQKCPTKCISSELI